MINVHYYRSKLFVGGLSWGTNDNDLRSRFEEYGSVADAVVIKDRETGRSRGYGYVTFESKDDADAAINGLDDSELDGRTIKVSYPQANFRGQRGYTDTGNGGGQGGG
ncbi:hypothetical protein BGZ49_003206, partial [Haplosporangium sp. Z 27]